MKQALEYLTGDFLQRDLPELTTRNLDLEPVKGKALTLIGMRRTGKSYRCYQTIQELLKQGVPIEHILYRRCPY